ncbi:hypothetical protein [Mariniphaga sp.]|uniref:hypothetical protein n=1 Tax=Mariniphaga sp. TaxID=1954475 RepID=UPI00356224CF
MILGLLFLGLQTFLAFFKPKYFVFTYILFISSYLGFLPRDILLGGNEIGLFYHSILMLATFILYNGRIKNLPKHFKIMLWGTLLLYMYGVVYPVINGSSSLMQSTIASKEFSSIFFIHFLFVNRNALSIELIHKNLSFFGYYFLIILSLFVFFNYIPPHYIKGPGQIQYNYPAILSLFLFIKALQAKSLKSKLFVFFLILVWTVGMYFEGHTAIMLTTSIGTTIVLFRIPLIKFTKNFKRLLVGVLLLTIILSLLPIEKYLIELKETSSFKARAVYNVERLELISKKPLQGYGFLHSSATELGDHIYTESLSFVDSGYIDLLGKFGIVGMMYFLIILTIPFFKNENNLLTIKSLKIFFIQYFFVNITWSVFSFSIGLIALALGIFLLSLSSK